jgi:alpha-N-arabinofuranosidase
MYAREYIRYATVCNEVDKKYTRFIICGANGHDISWTRRVMQEWAKGEGGRDITWGMAIHYYCGTAGAPQDFTEDQWYQLMFQASFMQRIVDDHRAAMDEFDPDRKLAMVIDEWGCWHKDGTGPSKGYNLFEQQSTMRDAVVSALTLNIFNNHCDKVRMANVAQLCNNLHALFLAGGEHCIVTPTYHVFDMYKGHQGAEAIETVVTDNEDLASSVSVSASVKDGKMLITLGNLSCTEDAELSLEGVGVALGAKARMTLLSHEDMHAHNTFDAPETVVPTTVDIDLAQPVVLPKASVAAIEIVLE